MAKWTAALTASLLETAENCTENGEINFQKVSIALNREIYDCQQQFYKQKDAAWTPEETEQLTQIWTQNAGHVNFAKISEFLGRSVFATKWQLQRQVQKRELEPFFELNSTNYGVEWTEKMDEILVQDRKNGSSFEKIGKGLKVSDRACQQRFAVLQESEFGQGEVELLRSIFVEKKGQITSQIFCDKFENHSIYGCMRQIWGFQGEYEFKYNVCYEVKEEKDE